MNPTSKMAAAILAELGRSASRDELADRARAAAVEHRGRVEQLVDAAPAAWLEYRDEAKVARVRRTMRQLPIPDADVEMIATRELRPTGPFEASKRFLASKSERFLVLLGAASRGKSLGALAAASDAVHRAAEAWARRVDAMGPEEWRRVVEEHPSRTAGEVVRRLVPTKPLDGGVAFWPSRSLPKLWEPWSSEVAEGARPVARDVPIVILDDLGCEDATTRFVAALGELLDERGRGGLQTLITSNVPAEAFRARYGDRVCERLNHLGRTFVASGPSLRRPGAL